MSWTAGYEVGDQVKCRHKGGWRLAVITAIHPSHCMVQVLGRQGAAASIYDFRNIKPWLRLRPQTETGPSTLNDQASLGF